MNENELIFSRYLNLYVEIKAHKAFSTTQSKFLTFCYALLRLQPKQKADR